MAPISSGDNFIDQLIAISPVYEAFYASLTGYLEQVTSPDYPFLMDMCLGALERITDQTAAAWKYKASSKHVNSNTFKAILEELDRITPSVEVIRSPLQEAYEAGAAKLFSQN